MEKVSDKDIRDVTTRANLSESDLDNVFVELGIPTTDIENAKHNSKSTDVDIQAAKVL